MPVNDLTDAKKYSPLDRAGLVVFLLGTAIYSYVLAFHYDWLRSIPGWFFFRKESLDHPYQYSYLFLMLAFALVVVFAVFKLTRQPLWALPLVIAVLFFLQIGFGFVQGHGFESIRVKYARAAVSEELQTVCQARENLLESIRNYDALYGEDFWLGTKPPGFFSFYALLRAGVGLFRPAVMNDAQACFITLTKNFAYFLPLFATLLLIPLYFIQKQITSQPTPFISALVYISAPSVILMTLLIDQFLFPLLFTVFLLLLAMMITRQSLLSAFLAGCLAYLLVFVSFSLLPIFGLTVIWLFVDYWINRPNRKLSRILLLLVVFFGGVLLAALLTWWLTGYNPIVRYQLAFERHREIKQFAFSAQWILQYTFLNHVDFMLWTGFGLLFLFYVSSARAFALFFQGKASTYDGFRIAFFLTFLVLNLIGQTKSEVGRLWVFLLPGFALVVFPESLKLLKNPLHSLQLFFITQMWSVFLVFYYIHFP
jgi:hypothetical protein